MPAPHPRTTCRRPRPADSSDAATPVDAPAAGSADSDAWVDVTDTPPAAQGPTDPK